MTRRTSNQTRRRPATMTNGHPADPVKSRLRTQGEPSINTARVTQSVQMRFNPLRGLTPEKLSSALDQFDLGFFRNAAIIWDKQERRDPVLKVVCPKRKKAIARHGYEILTVDQVPDGLEKMAEQQQADLKFFYNNLTATDALRPDQRGGLALLVRQMMDAKSKYYAVHETVYLPTPEGLTATFVFCPLWWFEGTAGKLRYLENEFGVYGRDMLPGEWLVTVGDGLMEASSVAKMFRDLCLQDWLNFCERYGQPFIDAATSASPDSPEWDALIEYAKNIQGDGAGVRSQGSSVQFLESKSLGADTFQKMVENMERALVRLWRGGDLGTTSSKDATGASLQGDESEILETDDATEIEETLATQVSRNVIAWRHGPAAPVLAYLKFRKAEKKNVDQDLKIDGFLLDAGAPLTVKNTLERYGRPCPEGVDDEALLRKPQTPAVPRDEEPADPTDVELANDAVRDDVATVLQETLLPLLARLDAIARIEDAGIQQAMLQKLLNDFPAIAAAIKADNSLANKLSGVLAKGLVAGLTTKPESKS